MAAAKHPPEVRDLAKSLYMTGLAPKPIAAQLNIPARSIHGWVKRLGWSNLRSKTIAAVCQNPRSLAERSEMVRSTLGTALERHAEQFAQIKVANGQAALKLHTKAEPFIRNASKVFGWEPGVQVASILSLQTVDPTSQIDSPES